MSPPSDVSLYPVPFSCEVSETGADTADQGLIERGSGAVIGQLKGLELTMAKKRLRVKDRLATLARYHKPVRLSDLIRHLARRARQAALRIGQPLPKGLV